MHPETFSLQSTRTAPAITEAVKDHTDTLLLQCGDLIEYINYAAIIRRVWNIETYEVYYPVAGGFVHEE